MWDFEEPMGISALVWNLAAAFKSQCRLCLPALCFSFKEMMQGMSRYWVRCMRESGKWKSPSTLGNENSPCFLNFEIQCINLSMHKMQSWLKLNGKPQINISNNEKCHGRAFPNHPSEVKRVFLMVINGSEVFKSLAFGNCGLLISSCH